MLHKNQAANSTEPAKWAEARGDERADLGRDMVGEIGRLIGHTRARQAMLRLADLGANRELDLTKADTKALARVQNRFAKMSGEEPAWQQTAYLERNTRELREVTQRHAHLPQVAALNAGLVASEQALRAGALPHGRTAIPDDGRYPHLDDSGLPTVSLEAGRVLVANGLHQLRAHGAVSPEHADRIAHTVAKSESGPAFRASLDVRRTLRATDELFQKRGDIPGADLFHRNAVFVDAWIGRTHERVEPMRAQDAPAMHKTEPPQKPEKDRARRTKQNNGDAR